MPIIKGTTPTIEVVFSKREISSLDPIQGFYFTFTQKGERVADLTRLLKRTGTPPAWDSNEVKQDPDTGEVVVSTTLLQTHTINLIADEELVCTVDVVYTETVTGLHNGVSTTENKRATSKEIREMVCDAERGYQVLNGDTIPQES